MSRRVFVATILGVMLCVWLGVADAGDAAKTREQLQQLRQSIEQVRHKISAESDKRSELSDALHKVQKRLADARDKLNTADSKIDHAKEKIETLDQTINEQRDRLSGKIVALKKQVRAAYENGQSSRLKLLLSNRPPAEIGRQLAYYHYITKAQSKQIARVKKALADLADNRRQLDKQRQVLRAKRQDRAAVLARLQKSRQSQKQTLAALDKQLSSHKKDVKSMRANAQELNNLLGDLKKQLNKVGPGSDVAFAKRQGKLPAPVDGKTVASFHESRDSGSLRWQGRWIAASSGTSVQAVAPGRVVYVGYLKRFGLITIIAHGKRYYTLFGHAASVFCRVGETVAAGEKIATAGKSGGHTQSGIFFQVRRGDKPLDPERWLAR